MTLIVGIKCGNGVVVAADSAATLGAFGQNTVEQNVTKLIIQQEKVILGFSGPVGLHQLQQDNLESTWGNALKSKRIAEVRTALSTKLATPFKEAANRAAVLQQLVGPPALSSVLSQTLISLPVDNQARLLEFTSDCNSEEITQDIPFTSIGSGKPFADPFLAFLKESLWDDSCPPTTGHGVLAALWTVDHVIKVNAGHGVGGRTQVGVLELVNEDWKARFLSEEELELHRQNILGAQTALRDYFHFDIDDE